MINLPACFLPFGNEKPSNNHDDVFNGNSSANSSSEIEDDEFSNCSGGGVILGSASECVLVALLSARSETLRKLKAKNPFVEDGVLLSKLVMYTSKLVTFCLIS